LGGSQFAARQPKLLAAARPSSRAGDSHEVTIQSFHFLARGIAARLFL
jgi:hypothetical protein